MCRRIRTVVVVLSTLVLSPMILAELAAQEFNFTGGAVEDIQVRTNNAPETRAEGTAFALLGSSTVTVLVNPGDSDLFVFEFDAECCLDGTFYFEGYVEVLARAYGPLGLSGSELQPQNLPTGVEFCGTNAEQGKDTAQSVSKSWAVRLNGGSSGLIRTFSIWWRVVDKNNDPFNAGLGRLDERTVRLTRYNIPPRRTLTTASDFE
jgi:hypothetical protein